MCVGGGKVHSLVICVPFVVWRQLLDEKFRRNCRMAVSWVLLPMPNLCVALLGIVSRKFQGNLVLFINCPIIKAGW